MFDLQCVVISSLEHGQDREDTGVSKPLTATVSKDATVEGGMFDAQQIRLHSVEPHGAR